ncbi:MAG: hypothetical protein HYW52_03135, partial [Gemmatimonadetes bacterium]|nr:hypothetical protein [Gemmatimonadota bacterium]
MAHRSARDRPAHTSRRRAALLRARDAGARARGGRPAGAGLPQARREAFYRNVRASAESGWDFSSRWMRDPKDLRTLETTDLVPVDLNSLLY